jgi:nicotinamide-nucleotide amidase
MEETPVPASPILAAVLLAIGSELTTGETRDTNSGELARSLSEAGVDVAWTSALPDRMGTVTAALRGALEAADLVVTTGGLGPTPDDLTREAIAHVCDEPPAVDPELERWLRHLFERRGIAFAEINLKQAWLIPSSVAIPNNHGTAPGWWVDRPNGRVVVALPGPPSEMRPMWRDWVLPRLRERGLGRERTTRTYRLTGIGESVVAAVLGEPLLRASNPIVATYARADAVDVRISAVAEAGRTANALVDDTEAVVLAALGEYVWGRDDDTWPAVLGRDLAVVGWTVALAEIGTGGAAAQLLGDAPWLKSAQASAPAQPEASDPDGLPRASAARFSLVDLAEQIRKEAGASVGLAVRAVESGEDTRVELALVSPSGRRESSLTAFLGGPEGRRRAGIAAAAFLHTFLRELARPEKGQQADAT